jgi:hypothetical protein
MYDMNPQFDALISQSFRIASLGRNYLPLSDAFRTECIHLIVNVSTERSIPNGMQTVLYIIKPFVRVN